ncbi:MAG: hypothetical protein MK082_01665 [Phycisphaerales bacterium]|nr:hypothetical protein [Phycisphaerales bacterium]
MTLRIAQAEAVDLPAVQELLPGAFDGKGRLLLTATGSEGLVGAGTIELLPGRSSPGYLAIKVATTGSERDETRRQLIERLAELGRDWGAAGIVLSGPSAVEGPPADRKRDLGFLPVRGFELWSIERSTLAELAARRTEDGEPKTGIVRAAGIEDLPKLIHLRAEHGIRPGTVQKAIRGDPGSCHLYFKNPEEVEPIGLLLFRERSDSALASTLWAPETCSIERGTTLLLEALADPLTSDIERIMMRGPGNPDTSFDLAVIADLGGTCFRRSAWWAKSFSPDGTSE